MRVGVGEVVGGVMCGYGKLVEYSLLKIVED